MTEPETASAIGGHDERFAKIEAGISTLKWMVGVNLAVSMLALSAMFTFLLRALPAVTPVIK